MNNSQNTCPECGSKNIEENSQMNPMQDVIRGKDLKVDKYPKYICKDCSKEFDK